MLRRLVQPWLAQKVSIVDLTGAACFGDEVTAIQVTVGISEEDDKQKDHPRDLTEVFEFAVHYWFNPFRKNTITILPLFLKLTNANYNKMGENS